MAAENNPGGIKVGDRVQRDPQWRSYATWPHGAKERRVAIIRDGGLTIGFDNWEEEGTWDADKFTVIRETRALPDPRYQQAEVDKLHPVAAACAPLNQQVGGDHYKSLKIQPVEYIHANKLGWCEANIVKYITRWRQKGQGADIDKVIHYAQLLKQLEGIS